MFTLTLAAVKEAARKAYDEGRLTAQNPDRPNPKPCVYDGGKATDGRPCNCAVGAALPPNVLAVIVARELNNCGITVSDFKGIISFPDGSDEVIEICSLQMRHDTWARITHLESRGRPHCNTGDAAAAERAFLALLK